MWVHGKKSILNNCKTIHVQPTAPEGFEGEWDDETEMKKVTSADAYEPLLKPITDDNRIQITKTMSQSAWSVRLMGDQSEYQNVNPAKPQVSNGVVVVRSL